MCGEKKLSFAYPLGTWGSPPRMRGKGNRSLSGGSSARITPAHAGKRRQTSGPSAAPRDHPRACGEKAIAPAIDAVPTGSPPRRRGKVAPCRGPRHTLRITPAHAGKSMRVYVGVTEIWAIEEGSPPRMRGKGRLFHALGHYHGITPAHAGKRTGDRSDGHCRWDHPRACGEKLHCSAHFPRTKGSPPRVRGKADFVY